MKRYVYMMVMSGSLLAVPSDDRAPASPVEIAVAQTAATIPSGPEIFGVYRGRTPCQELSAQLNVAAREACNKIKCRLTLYQDPATKMPTTYSWMGKTNWTGKWSIVKGTKTDPNAVVYQLEPVDPHGFLSFLEFGPDILFVLNRDGSPLVGNNEFSYTLNRIVKK